MKFQLVIEAESKRLLLIPEGASEAAMLATICDPNTPGDSEDEKMVRIKVNGSTDRAPYRKVVSLEITL